MKDLAPEALTIRRLQQSFSEVLPSHIGLTPVRYGVMAYLKHDYYIGGSLEKYGEFSQEECAFFELILGPSDIVVEVGANIGAHTLRLAQLVGKEGTVLAFEPQKFLYQLLCGNMALNGLTNVIAHNAGLGSSRGIMNVPPQNYEECHNFGGIDLSDEAGDPVNIFTLDDYQLPRLNLLKVDVEGMECEVLQGATGTIARCRPMLYVENDRLDKSEKLITQIKSMGYKLWWHFPCVFNPGNFFSEPENIFSDTASMNMFCIPAELNVTVNLMEVESSRQTWQDALKIYLMNIKVSP